MSLVLPLSDWPVQDRDMWLNLQIEGGPLDDCGALSHLRATSLKTLELRYARWLQWLINSDAEAITLPPARRGTLPRLSAWLRDLSHTRPMTQLMFIDGVLRILSASDPAQDWSAQRKLKAGLKRAAGRGDRDRKLGRVLSSEVLFRAGLILATGHAEAAPTPLRGMMCLRDGTMIAMLALMPMRRRAFAGLRIGTSLYVAADTMTVALPGDLTKSGQPWEADVPQSVEPLVRRYVNEARPFFYGAWPTASRCPVGWPVWHSFEERHAEPPDRGADTEADGSPYSTAFLSGCCRDNPGPLFSGTRQANSTNSCAYELRNRRAPLHPRPDN